MSDKLQYEMQRFEQELMYAMDTNSTPGHMTADQFLRKSLPPPPPINPPQQQQPYANNLFNMPSTAAPILPTQFIPPQLKHRMMMTQQSPQNQFQSHQQMMYNTGGQLEQHQSHQAYMHANATNINPIMSSQLNAQQTNVSFVIQNKTNVNVVNYSSGGVNNPNLGTTPLTNTSNNRFIVKPPSFLTNDKNLNASSNVSKPEKPTIKTIEKTEPTIILAAPSVKYTNTTTPKANAFSKLLPTDLAKHTPLAYTLKSNTSNATKTAKNESGSFTQATFTNQTQLLPNVTPLVSDTSITPKITILKDSSKTAFSNNALSTNHKNTTGEDVKSKKEKKNKKKKKKSNNNPMNQNTTNPLTLVHGGTSSGVGAPPLKKNKIIVRYSEGSCWFDPSLLDWDPNDYRIFCGDLGNEVTDEVLARAFNRYPSFQRARVIRDKRNNKTKGYGFVSFKDALDYAKAMKEMNGKYVGGRPVKLRKSIWRERNLDLVRKKIKDKQKLVAEIKAL